VGVEEGEKEREKKREDKQKAEAATVYLKTNQINVKTKASYTTERE